MIETRPAPESGQIAVSTTAAGCRLVRVQHRTGRDCKAGCAPCLCPLMRAMKLNKGFGPMPRRAAAGSRCGAVGPLYAGCVLFNLTHGNGMMRRAPAPDRRV